MEALSSHATEILCCYEERSIGQNATAQKTFIEVRFCSDVVVLFDSLFLENLLQDRDQTLMK